MAWDVIVLHLEPYMSLVRASVVPCFCWRCSRLWWRTS